METNTKLPDYSGIKMNGWFFNSIDGDNAVVNDENGFLFEAPNEQVGRAISDAINATFGKGINPLSIPKILKENEELKAKNETYAKDYNEMVKEVLRLSRENSKMKEMVAERINELEK